MDYEKLLKNDKGKISFTKLGTLIIGISSAVIASDLLPEGTTIKIMELIRAIGATIAGIGIRDLVGGKK